MVREAGCCPDGSPARGPPARHQCRLHTRLRVQRLSDVSARPDGQEPWLTAPICLAHGCCPATDRGEASSEGWRLQEVTLPVGRVPTTMPKPLATLDARSGMLPLLRGNPAVTARPCLENRDDETRFRA